MPISTKSRDNAFRQELQRAARWFMICGAGAMLVSAMACSPCMNNPCDNGLACDGLETCTDDGGQAICTDGTPVECEFPTFCTEPDGACVDPCDGADCSDDNHCTTDSCVTNQDGTTTCDNSEAGCDDGDSCTELDACDPDGEEGNCAGTPIECPEGGECVNGSCPCTENATCDDGDACNGVETCDTGTGSCVAGTPLDCDDDDLCTVDDCDATAGCSNTAKECADGEICDPATGECAGTTVAVSLSEETVSFDHEVGVTECPQKFGSFSVTNTGNVATDYTVAVGDAPLTATPSSFALAPGASQTVTLEFTCAQSTSFGGTVTVTGEAAGQTAEAALAITGNVE